MNGAAETSATVPQAFLHWQDTLPDLFEQTRKFPKTMRFTFAHRIDNLALDVIEDLVEARYAPRSQKTEALARIDLHLARLRVLLRLATSQRLMDKKSYERLNRQVSVLGRMVGGWKKQVRS